MYPGSKSLRGQNHYPLLLLLSSSTNHPFLSALSAGRTNHGKCESVSHSVLFLCNPTNCSPPGSSVHGILQARISEWVAMPSSRGSSQPKDRSSIAGGFFAVTSSKWVCHRVAILSIACFSLKLCRASSHVNIQLQRSITLPGKVKAWPQGVIMSLGRGDAGDSWLPAPSSLAIALAFGSRKIICCPEKGPGNWNCLGVTPGLVI